jgi:hypothetical protein
VQSLPHYRDTLGASTTGSEVHKEEGMTPTKSKERGSTRSAPVPANTPDQSTAQSEASGRKPWKKKTPVEIFRGQVERLREDVQEKEAELNQARKQLQKLEEAIKLLESV